MSRVASRVASPVGSRVGSRAEEGSATVLAAAAVGVLVLLLGLGLQLGAGVLARHRAEGAADLAALAAAREVVRGVDVACARAGELAGAHGARLVSCTPDGWAVTVVVTVRCRCVPSVSPDAVGRARAGPVAGRRHPDGAVGGDRGRRLSSGSPPSGGRAWVSGDPLRVTGAGRSFGGTLAR